MYFFISVFCVKMFGCQTEEQLILEHSIFLKVKIFLELKVMLKTSNAQFFS